MTGPLQAPIVVFTGAGLSTDSGIPDFRSPGGVWERFDPMEFTIERFHADPDAFWERRARLIAAMDYLDAAPNAAHNAIAEAARDGRVAHVVTQNIDGLHAKAGTPADRLIELHGNGARVICTRCRRRALTVEVLMARNGAPRCTCGGVQKPDVVLFGEAVTAMPHAASVVADAATLLVVGTSLRVYPAAGLVDVARAHGADLVICNRDATPYDAHAVRVLRGPIVDEVPRILDH